MCYFSAGCKPDSNISVLNFFQVLGSFELHEGFEQQILPIWRYTNPCINDSGLEHILLILKVWFDIQKDEDLSFWQVVLDGVLDDIEYY